jgi:hypothetical protein
MYRQFCHCYFTDTIVENKIFAIQHPSAHFPTCYSVGAATWPLSSLATAAQTFFWARFWRPDGQLWVLFGVKSELAPPADTAPGL